jgi:hypothetical protein
MSVSVKVRMTQVTFTYVRLRPAASRCTGPCGCMLLPSSSKGCRPVAGPCPPPSQAARPAWSMSCQASCAEGGARRARPLSSLPRARGQKSQLSTSCSTQHPHPAAASGCSGAPPDRGAAAAHDGALGLSLLAASRRAAALSGDARHCSGVRHCSGASARTSCRRFGGGRLAAKPPPGKRKVTQLRMRPMFHPQTVRLFQWAAHHGPLNRWPWPWNRTPIRPYCPLCGSTAGRVRPCGGRKLF